MVDSCAKSKEKEKPKLQRAAAELEAVLSASLRMTSVESSDDEMPVPESYRPHVESPGRRRHVRGSSREAMSQKSLLDDVCDSVSTGDGPGETLTLIANIGDMTFESYEAASTRSVGSRRSRKSRLSRKSMRPRRRGKSLERDVSLLILNTAAGGAESAHFLVIPAAPSPIKSAEDILSDLFVSQNTSLETFSLDKADGNAEFPNLFNAETSAEEPETTADLSMSSTEPAPSTPEKENTSASPGLTRNYVLESKKETTGDSIVISESLTEDSLFAFSDVLEEPPKSGNEALYPEDAQDPIQSKWNPNKAPKKTAFKITNQAEGSTLEANSFLTLLTREANSVWTDKAGFATGNKPSSPGRSPKRSPDRSSHRTRRTPNDAPKETATASTKEAEASMLEPNSVLTSSTLEALSVLINKAAFAAANKPSSSGHSPKRSPDRSSHRTRRTPNDAPKETATASTKEAEGSMLEPNSVLTSSTLEAHGVLIDKAVFAAGNKPSSSGHSLNRSPNRSPDRARNRISASDGASEVQVALSFVSSSTAEENVLSMVLNTFSTIEEAGTSFGKASRKSTTDVEEDVDFSVVEREEIFLDRLVNIVDAAQKEEPANVDLSLHCGSKDDNESNCTEYNDTFSVQSGAETPTSSSVAPVPNKDDFIKSRIFGEEDQEAEWTEFDTSPFTNLDNMTEASGSSAPAPLGDKSSPDSPTSITDITDFSKISDLSSSSSIREAAKTLWRDYDTRTNDLVSL